MSPEAQLQQITDSAKLFLPRVTPHGLVGLRLLPEWEGQGLWVLLTLVVLQHP